MSSGTGSSGGTVAESPALPPSLPPPSIPPPSMLEVLGEHLYTKVSELQEGGGGDGDDDGELDVPKVTGILLELGEQKVLQLLQDGQLLQQSVQQIIQHIPGIVLYSASAKSPGDSGEVSDEDSDTDGEGHSDLEEQLYHQVCHQEPQLSQQITGMLLELGRGRVKRLITSPSTLTQAVHQARTAYSHHHHTDTGCATGQDCLQSPPPH